MPNLSERTIWMTPTEFVISWFVELYSSWQKSRKDDGKLLILWFSQFPKFWILSLKMIVQLGGLQNLRGMEKTKINDCLFVIKFSSYWYHHKIVIISLWDKKNRFVTVLWSQSAIRVEKIKISRKRDLHKIIIISLWDHDYD